MRRPKTVDIYGLPYKVELASDMMMADQAGNQEPCWGSMCTTTKIIRLFKGNKNIAVGGETMTNSLLHEMIHAVLRENYSLMALLKDGTEEMFVDGFATNMADTLMRNGLIEDIDW